MSQNATTPYLGDVILQKMQGAISGTYSMATGAGGQVFIPVAVVNPRNPNNIAYPPVVNASAFLSVKVRGKRTPSITLQWPAKSTDFTAKIVNSLILNSTTDPAATPPMNSDTDAFVIRVNDTSQVRYYSYARCAQLSIYQTATGGPVMCEAAFVCRYGDNDDAASYSFNAPTTDAGSLYDISDTVFSGIDQVRAWRLTMIRAQAPLMYADGTLYPASVKSGMMGGTFMLEQSPTYSGSPSTSVAFQIGPASTGHAFTVLLNRDEDVLDQTTQLGNKVRMYTLFDNAAGGNPVTVVNGV